MGLSNLLCKADSKQPSYGVTIIETPSRNDKEKCYRCIFKDDSDLESNCVAVAHPCHINSLYPDLFNISTIKFVRDGSQAVGCIDVSQCVKEYRVVVFYFDGGEGLIKGQPIKLKTGIHNNNDKGLSQNIERLKCPKSIHRTLKNVQLL